MYRNMHAAHFIFNSFPFAFMYTEWKRNILLVVETIWKWKDKLFNSFHLSFYGRRLNFRCYNNQEVFQCSDQIYGRHSINMRCVCVRIVHRTWPSPRAEAIPFLTWAIRIKGSINRWKTIMLFSSLKRALRLGEKKAEYIFFGQQFDIKASFFSVAANDAP